MSERLPRLVDANFDILSALSLADELFATSVTTLRSESDQIDGTLGENASFPLPPAPQLADPARLAKNRSGRAAASAACRALAIELCFKTISRGTEAKVLLSHDLVLLWKQLDDDWQSVIRREYNKQAELRKLEAAVLLRWAPDISSAGPLSVRCGG
jgi:hypothetical protein